MSENRIVKENNSDRENLTSSDSEERELLQAAQGEASGRTPRFSECTSL